MRQLLACALALVILAIGTAPSAQPVAANESGETLSQIEARVMVHFKAGEHAEAMEAAQEMLKKAEEVGGPKGEQVVATLDLIAGLAINTGDFKGASEAFERMIAILEETKGQSDPHTLKVIFAYATTKQRAGDAAQAQALYQRVIDQAGDKSAQAVEAQVGLAESLRTTGGDLSRAEKLLRQAASIQARTLGDKDIKYGATLNNLALVLMQKGSVEQSLALFKQAVAIWEKALGPEHPQVALGLSNTAEVLRQLQRLDAAVEHLERAAAIRKKALGPKHPDTGQSFNAMATVLLTKGDYKGARASFVEALSIWEAALGSKHPWVATVLDNIATCDLSLGTYARGEPLVDRAIIIWEGLPGDPQPGLAMSLYNKGTILKVTGRIKEAEAYYVRAIAIWEKTMGKRNPLVAKGLDALGMYYREVGDTKRADTNLMRALSIREQVLGPKHPDVAITLNNLGTLYTAKAQYDRAESVLRRAVSIWERAYGKDHPLVATALDSLGQALRMKGSLARAETTLRRALDIRVKALGPKHLETVSSSENLGMLLQQAGDYDRARSIFEAGIVVREAQLGPDHPFVGQSLNNLAMLYLTLGLYDRVEPLLKRAIAIWTKTLSAEHAMTLQARANLAMLYGEQGDYARAGAILEQIVVAQKRVLGARHPEAALSLNNLGVLHLKRGDLDKAEVTFKQALRALKAALGPKHASIATAWNNLGEIERRRGNLKAAMKAYGRSIKILDTRGTKPRPELSRGLNNVAMIHMTRGDFAKAEPLFVRAAQITEDAQGRAHPTRINYLLNLVILHMKQGAIDKAYTLQREAQTLIEENLTILLVRGSEAQKRAFFGTVVSGAYLTYALHLSQAPDDPKLASLAFESLLRQKGRVLDAQADTYSTLRKNLDEAGQKLFETLASLRARQAAMVFSGPAGWDPAAFEAASKDIAQQIDETERALAERSTAFESERTPITLDAVRERLGDDSALVEIIRWLPFDLSGDKKGLLPLGPDRYAAYILHKAPDKMAFVDLGPAEAIDEKVAAFREAIVAQAPIDTLAKDLHTALIAPLTSHLDGAEHLLLAPDSQLNLLPFDALMDPKGRFLIETHQITWLTTGRDLLRLGDEIQHRAPPLFIGDPDYGQPDAGASDLPTQWSRLPGTRAEVEAIAPLLANAAVMTGSDATETALKQTTGPQVLHLATHGFFLHTREESAGLEGATRGFIFQPGVKLERDKDDKPARTGPQRPLLRSGLVLSGANVPTQAVDDGNMTASEVSALDLWGTRLVVLSACETGVGEVKHGRGVFGLRRALVLAGARSQVMSLWQVSDEATEATMIAMYQKLVAGQGTTQALREARLEMLQAPDTRHPFFWAAFIPSGDWRPIGLEAAPEEVEVPQKVEPGPRGCACQTPASPGTGSGWILVLLAVVGVWRRR